MKKINKKWIKEKKRRAKKSIYHVNGHQKKAGVAILTLDKLDLKIKTIRRNEERHYIIIKMMVQQEDITIVNIYAPSMEHLNI